MFNQFKSVTRWGGGDRSSDSKNDVESKKKLKKPPVLEDVFGDGPPRLDGSDRYFGMENIISQGRNGDGAVSNSNGNTCYCNSILQCLFYSKPFRENVVNFPARGQPPYQPPSPGSKDGSNRPLVRINTEPLPTTSASSIAAAAKAREKLASPSKAEKKIPLPATAMVQMPINIELNKDTSEYKKQKARDNGPILDIDQGNHQAYGMEESLFTALKDIFESVMAHPARTGVVKPNKFLELVRRGNDMYSGQQHQDAHEFLNYVLNEVIDNVEEHQRKMQSMTPPKNSGTSTPVETQSLVSAATNRTVAWIHELFEGLLSSETKCLTCERVSRRDEKFLDLSIDLEKHTSVTSCLRNFSASEMLTERNKFHCDGCGGLQEAEKRMKIKRLPRILALHLKRFKYMEATGRFEKLHYKVVYPMTLRLFNTSDEADCPDKLYELYAVVIHIGGGPLHGHYVAVVKTEDKGWLLFDDELVESVSEAYVRNFFGGNATNMATAYVLFYQETNFDSLSQGFFEKTDPATAAMQAAMEQARNLSDIPPPGSPLPGVAANGAVTRLQVEVMEAIHPSISSPIPIPDHPHDPRMPANIAAEHPPVVKSKKEREREKKEEKEREKAERKAAKASASATPDDGSPPKTGMSRFRNTSRSLRAPPKWLGGGSKDKDKKEEKRRGSRDEINHVLQSQPSREDRGSVATQGHQGPHGRNNSVYSRPTSQDGTLVPPLPSSPNLNGTSTFYHQPPTSPTLQHSETFPTHMLSTAPGQTTSNGHGLGITGSSSRLKENAPPEQSKKSGKLKKADKHADTQPDPATGESSAGGSGRKKLSSGRPSIFGLRKKAQMLGSE
ncbi:putative ubiquitin carboxyl-terminal hydrolase creB [Pyronema domesticum]|uniref:ubiquitinyl hydrolase 1 n=1 Tax=Pyronema omphalodes (strain CBS 100304) TaxID=1076935 RepID=U4LD73_PYROM|nr:putative ubiquitin carboxyl-terminal hydrolase creB [Pyronema domesticum]CCX08498.1 Similar to Probable ubiquitin carboxyl-terminal hydrolase creB; acc. no. B0Y4P5 [Pyronema omphalodes CBS 100304]